MAPQEVVVVTGAGGMGHAVARRIGGGRVLVLADVRRDQLDAVVTTLVAGGFDAHAFQGDVSSQADVDRLVATATALGPLRCLVHTAGVSPTQAPPDRIVEVDVIGTARVLDAFEPHVRPGAVAVCIASMAGTFAALDDDTCRLLATTPTDELRALSVLDPAAMDSGMAYAVAKRANQVRVQAASVPWGRRGGRVVSISPGVIATPMGASELAGASGDVMRTMIEMSGTGRIGTPEDVAAVVEFLVGPAASFITGIDLLVDGGVVAAVRTSAPGAGS